MVSRDFSEFFWEATVEPQLLNLQEPLGATQKNAVAKNYACPPECSRQGLYQAAYAPILLVMCTQDLDCFWEFYMVQPQK